MVVASGERGWRCPAGAGTGPGPGSPGADPGLGGGTLVWGKAGGSARGAPASCPPVKPLSAKRFRSFGVVGRGSGSVHVNVFASEEMRENDRVSVWHLRKNVYCSPAAGLQYPALRLEDEVYDEDGNTLQDFAYDHEPLGIANPSSMIGEMYTLYYPPEKSRYRKQMAVKKYLAAVLGKRYKQRVKNKGRRVAYL
ncbi:PREDICTED: pituitary adenylate cyclase-activating polypeptide [Chaetura pelagica]|uniref:pituitary adenylate cyclase-activating polypeptide n=1 Tax=Chaetura pelagica TaxID=8897 RepID=UPI0005232A90|nr:PREDICTED: pituitary adenylate cyclase-activating polypeptide [Chaetura pelagica]